VTASRQDQATKLPMLLYRTSSACLNDLLVDKSSSLLRMLGCYGSATFSEIFNALGTDIVTACLYPVKGILNESLLESGYWVFKDLPFGRDHLPCYGQRGMIIPAAVFMSRVNQYQFFAVFLSSSELINYRDRQKNEHKTGML